MSFQQRNICHSIGQLPRTGRRRSGRNSRSARGSGRVEVARLERRLAKVKALLEAKEGELRQARRRSSAEQEQGVASKYREVQGLYGTGSLVERKRKMMQRIFEANLELQKR